MALYYVNSTAQTNGDHEVHQSGCRFMPAESSRIYLGNFSNCQEAVRAARVHYIQVNGCYYCSNECHTQ